jgi:hypothetical protein
MRLSGRCSLVTAEAAFEVLGFVLKDAVAQVVRHADVESAAGSALQDVHVEVVFAHAET